jgi:hypothetical protein
MAQIWILETKQRVIQSYHFRFILTYRMRVVFPFITRAMNGAGAEEEPRDTTRHIHVRALLKLAYASGVLHPTIRSCN